MSNIPAPLFVIPPALMPPVKVVVPAVFEAVNLPVVVKPPMD